MSARSPPSYLHLNLSTAILWSGDFHSMQSSFQDSVNRTSKSSQLVWSYNSQCLGFELVGISTHSVWIELWRLWGFWQWTAFWLGQIQMFEYSMSNRRFVKLHFSRGLSSQICNLFQVKYSHIQGQIFDQIQIFNLVLSNSNLSLCQFDQTQIEAMRGKCSKCRSLGLCRRHR